MINQDILIILISLFLSAIFSGSEIAFISANKLQLELQGEKQTLGGRILSRFVHRPTQFISTTLLGNTITLVVYGIFMAKILEPWIWGNLPVALQNEGSVLIVQTVISTLIVLITAEFLPKSVFMINPNRVIYFMAIPVRFIYILLYPLVVSIVGLSKFIITRILGLEFDEEKPAYSLPDLNNLIKSLQEENPNSAVEVDTKILDNVLDFKSVRVRECMIPRTEIVAVDIQDDIEELRTAFVESGHSKILVYRNSIDDVIGYCHSLELFKKPENIESILTPIEIIPETILANELMVRFINEHKSLALVVDEFGGTSGVVTMEDIIEEIFGEIQDEHDDETLVEQKVDKNTYVLSARHEIDYLNDKYGWDLPTGEYETLGGLILSVTEDLPEKNQLVHIGEFEIQIESVQDIRIDTVRIISK
jgi:CBS domain containing-hemolysin-like protein